MDASVESGHGGFLRLRVEVGCAAGEEIGQDVGCGGGEVGVAGDVGGEVGEAGLGLDLGIELRGARVEVEVFCVPAGYSGVVQRHVEQSVDAGGIELRCSWRR